MGWGDERGGVGGYRRSVARSVEEFRVWYGDKGQNTDQADRLEGV